MLRSTASVRSAYKLALTTGIGLFFLTTLYAPSFADLERLDLQNAFPPLHKLRIFNDHPDQLAQYTPPPHRLPFLMTGVEPAISGRDVAFGDFLRQRIKLTSNTVIWLTIADGVYAKTAVRHLALFMDTMNHNKLAEEREELVVLCIDEECVAECAKYGEFAYAGFSYTVKKDLVTTNPAMNAVSWVKTRGLIEILEAGYACVFADGDVFLRKDPRPYFKPLTDPSWDLQIQDEVWSNYVNIGFFFQRPTSLLIRMWKDVLDGLEKSTPINPVWDQVIVNQLLKSTEVRTQPNNGKALSEFVGPSGIKVSVLNVQYFWALHLAVNLGWLWQEETSLIHMSCADNMHLKFYLAGTYGGWRNVDQYYTKPRRILIGPELVGTSEELLIMMKLLIVVAQATNRDILPPIRGVYQVGEELHRRSIWSLFPLGEIEEQFGVTILEPNYLEHVSQFANPASVAALHNYTEYDLRRSQSLPSLLASLALPPFHEAPVVRITTDQSLVWSFGNWQYPDRVAGLEMCKRIEENTNCMNFCRRS